MPKSLIFLLLIVTSCQSQGKLKFLGDLSNSLEEVSAVEMYDNPNELFVIEDSGNKNKIFVLDSTANLLRTITVKNTRNRDWEDLTLDGQGNLYIGDFGNNDEDDLVYSIYKVGKNDLNNDEVEAQKIEFTLPKDHKAKDFEAFFIVKNIFYVFSKERKDFYIYKVPNRSGRHKAAFHSTFNLPGKENKITSADISEDGEIMVLLNHDKLWRLSDFDNDDYFSGNTEELKFNHNSQKEGICFKTNSKVLITDERKGSEGGNVYEFNLNDTKQ